MKPVMTEELTPSQKREALTYLMFLKQKQCGKVKARGSTDSHKQRDKIPKHESASPTVSTESVFLTAVVDAHEGQVVKIIDVPGAFMQADQDDLVHIQFTGEMVEKLLKINHDMYAPYVTWERKQKVMYVELLKALYGTIKVAKYWQKLTTHLMDDLGFLINPYDSCMANQMIDGKQCTIVWHVDNVKISHMKEKVVDDMIAQWNSEFGTQTTLMGSSGTSHDYLGMTLLDFLKPSQLVVSMMGYIDVVLCGAPAEMNGTAVTPAVGHLFCTNKGNAPPVMGKWKDLFHHITMQLAYLAQRA